MPWGVEGTGYGFELNCHVTQGRDIVEGRRAPQKVFVLLDMNKTLTVRGAMRVACDGGLCPLLLRMRALLLHPAFRSLQQTSNHAYFIKPCTSHTLRTRPPARAGGAAPPGQPAGVGLRRGLQQPLLPVPGGAVQPACGPGQGCQVRGLGRLSCEGVLMKAGDDHSFLLVPLMINQGS